MTRAWSINDPQQTTAFDDLEPLIRASARPDRLTIVCYMGRPGTRRFITTLEFQEFDWHTTANHEFQLLIVKWPDTTTVVDAHGRTPWPHEPLVWFVVIVPWSTLPAAETIAEPIGMRLSKGIVTLAPGPGKSMAMYATRKPLNVPGQLRFPCDHSHVRTLEHDTGSPIYLAGGTAFIEAEERRWIEQFQRDHPEWGSPRPSSLPEGL